LGESNSPAAFNANRRSIFMRDRELSKDLNPNFVFAGPNRQGESAFKPKERKEANAKGMPEYEAEGLAVRAKMIRLKTLRLDQEARESLDADKVKITPTKKAIKGPSPHPGKTASTKAASMAG
jgi:hypothetical protein